MVKKLSAKLRFFALFVYFCEKVTYMLLSMTGFGKAVAEADGKKITVEIKSLNSKQLDLSLRLPSQLRESEPDVRAEIAHTLERGKVEATVYVEQQGDDSVANFNMPLIKAYKERLESMSAELGIPEPDDWYSVLMRLPDVMRSDVTTAASDAECEALLAATRGAVEGLMAFRRREGEKLERFFTQRIERIGELLSEVDVHEQERVGHIRARIEDGLARLANVEIDRGRLEQEMIYYIEKLDVNEEKQRLAQHLTYFMETMGAPSGQGKKLGFISQEIGREINTLGSKSNHAEMQKIVVRMKDELEQVKEQVLNVM